MVKIVSVSEVTAGPTFEGKSALGTRLRLFCLFVFCLVCLFFVNLRSGVFFSEERERIAAQESAVGKYCRAATLSRSSEKNNG